MLYVIPTPIWNLDDITFRGYNLLKNLEYFLSEDTRTTKQLFKHYEINYSNKKFYSITSFTPEKKLEFYKDLLTNFDVWLISEAGTPGLSDPGKSIIKIANENNLEYEILPGTNALIPAVVSSWFDTSSFIFLWFLPTKKWRQKKIKFICQSEVPVFVYESVHRIQKLIEEIKKEWFNWKISISREISKKFEQKITWSIEQIENMIKNKQVILKGEFVVWFYNIN